ncbi:MAG: hypothetical protein IJ558_11210 [Treponema sp.]|nr:hypothetical protein [Treponema sp.]
MQINDFVHISAAQNIGEKAVIGAGSVVTKSVPEYCVAAGNPARVIKRFDAESGMWKKV